MKTLSAKGAEYDIKILLAWGESISGNQEITKWLTKNGFPELGLFHFALRNEDRSRKWLIDNGFPQLMALISATEGNEEARNWLENHGFTVLHQMALSADGETSAHDKLLQSDFKIYAVLAKKMQVIKDQIEEDKSDFHKYYTS